MSFCRNANDSQLRNILCDEARRYHAHTDPRFPNEPSALAVAAKELYQEAREECARRGIDPDEVLRDARVASIQ